MNDIELIADAHADLIALWEELDATEGPESRNLPDLTAHVKAMLSPEPF